MTIEELAKELRVSTSFLYRASAAGKLPSVRVGNRLRFDPEAVRAWLNQPASDPVIPHESAAAMGDDETFELRRKQVRGKVELLIVQRELCEPEEGLPDGVWETLKGFHINEDECMAVIAGERATQSYLDSDDQVFRIVKILGEVVKIDKPKEEE